MKTVEITKKLISLPSFVGKDANEKKASDYIFEYLKKNSQLEVGKQRIGKDRFNIIATKGQRVDTLITGHIDTVQSSANWSRNPLKPVVSGEKLYGLGSSDMKSGIAIMLSLSTLSELINNVMFLFYCDEEYDFWGMKKFIEKYKRKIKPKLIISLDGDGLQIGNSCRGLIELEVKVQGKSGHAANPKKGTNAILESTKVIEQLKSWLKNFSTKELGNSSLNVSYIQGGTNMGRDKKKNVILGKEGNIIPDYCEYIIEIRVASDKLDAKSVSGYIKEKSKELELKVNSIKTRHDLGSWITPKKQLKRVIDCAPNKVLRNAKDSGYIDIQMLWQAFKKTPTFYFGAGEPGMAHKANEFVKMSNIKRVEQFYRQILTNKRLC